MTYVHFWFNEETEDGPRPSLGSVRFQPAVQSIENHRVILPTSFCKELLEGELLLNLTPGVWKVSEPTFFGKNRYVLVPKVPDPSEILEYDTLVEVDPLSLQPNITPQEIWWAALEAIPLPSFAVDPDNAGALLATFWSWQTAAGDPNALVVQVEED